jgi:curved DNA-binding protein CbpA
MGAWAKGTAALGYDDAMAHRDPHDVLGVDRDASQATVKAAWRRLAREHHPDLAADSTARRDATRRMAEINAAYQALRSSAAERVGKSGRDAAAAGGPGAGPRAPEAVRPSGPPPPPPTRPVTARLDTTDLFRQRNATTTPAGGGYRHRPRPPVHLRRATWGEAEAPRASDPTGPLHRVRARRSARRPPPDLDAALATRIVFGKFHGRTLGEIAALERTYLEWVERTITRDPDLVAAARVVLDRRARQFANGGESASGGHPASGGDPASGAFGAAGTAAENENGDAGRRPRGEATRRSAG